MPEFKFFLFLFFLLFPFNLYSCYESFRGISEKQWEFNDTHIKQVTDTTKNRSSELTFSFKNRKIFSILNMRAQEIYSDPENLFFLGCSDNSFKSDFAYFIFNNQGIVLKSIRHKSPRYKFEFGGERQFLFAEIFSKNKSSPHFIVKNGEIIKLIWTFGEKKEIDLLNIKQEEWNIFVWDELLHIPRIKGEN